MENIQFKVDVWRDEFKVRRNQLGKSWKSLLSEEDNFFATDEGRKAMDAVSDGRANLERTVKVVETMRKIEENMNPKKAQKTTKSLAEKYPAAHQAMTKANLRYAEIDRKNKERLKKL